MMLIYRCQSDGLLSTTTFKVAMAIDFIRIVESVITECVMTDSS
jgi:hypothetical protein